MTVREFYENIHGEYDAIHALLSSDAIIMRFVKRFPADPSYRELVDAVQKGDIQAGFEAAHKLKGLAANLAFSALYASACRLTDQLRPQTEPADPVLVQAVSESYHAVLHEITLLENRGNVQ